MLHKCIKMKKSLGLVLQELNIHREKLFLISKVDNDNQWYEQTVKSFNESLNNLQTDYLESPELQKIADNQVEKNNFRRINERV